MKKLETVLDRENRYWSYREAARQLVVQQLNDITDIDVRLSDINASALQQASLWSQNYNKTRIHHKPGWDWKVEVAKYRRRPKRVELAIWVDQTLCGLVLGRVSDQRVVASIHLLESNPAQHHLMGNIALIATRYLDAFAVILDCKETSVELPVPALIEFYMDLGFKTATTRGLKVIRLKKTL